MTRRGALLGRGSRPSAAAAFALPILLAGVCVPAWGASGDTVTLVLKDGQVLEGRVVDRGGADLEVGRRHGRTHVPKAKVDRWSYHPPEGDAELKPVLVLESGLEVEGDVSMDEARGEWVVRTAIGEARYPTREVRRIIQINGMTTDSGFTPRGKFLESVRRAISEVRGDDERARAHGEELLRRVGFFALQPIRESLAEVGVGDVDPGGRLGQIALEERIRASLPAAIAKRDPAFGERLLTASAGERLTLLRETFFEVGEEIYPLLGALLLDPLQPAEVRGFAVDLLQRTHQVVELVEAYRSATGRAQLAVAIALADAGIYIGLPSLIDALELEGVELVEKAHPGGEPARLDVRTLAIQKLEEYTGERLGYDPMADAEARAQAVTRWRSWWGEHRADIESTLRFRLHPEARDPRRQRAAQLWRQGNEAWARNEVPVAEELFHRAIDEDPTCLPPFVCLGIIAYQVHGRYEEAGDWFRRALRREPGAGEKDVLRLAFYHLGRIREIGLEFEAAQGFYRKAIEVDENYADAWRDLGMVVYKDALTRTSAPRPEKEARFREAAAIFEEGLEKLSSYRKGLVFLGSTNIPVGSDLPFSSRQHNRGLRDLRQRLQREEASFAHQIAVVHLALGEREQAREWARRAAESPQPSADHILLYARVLRELGQVEVAREQERKARTLDPTNPLLPPAEQGTSGGGGGDARG